MCEASGHFLLLRFRFLVFEINFFNSSCQAEIFRLHHCSQASSFSVYEHFYLLKDLIKNTHSKREREKMKRGGEIERRKREGDKE